MVNSFYDFKPLRPDNTFDNFVEGSCNRIARCCASVISENPGDRRYNPFTIISPVGCGKSHLVQAMYNKLVSGQSGRSKSENHPGINKGISPEKTPNL